MPPRVRRASAMQVLVGVALLWWGLDQGGGLAVLGLLAGMASLFLAAVTAIAGPRLARLASGAIRVVLVYVPFWIAATLVLLGTVWAGQPGVAVLFGSLLILPGAVTAFDLGGLQVRWRNLRDPGLDLPLVEESVELPHTSTKVLTALAESEQTRPDRRAAALAILADRTDAREDAVRIARQILRPNQWNLLLMASVIEAMRDCAELSDVLVELVEAGFPHDRTSREGELLRAHMLVSFATWREPRCRTFAIEALDSPEPFVQQGAAEALGSFAGREVSPHVELLHQRTDDLDVAYACRMALKQMALRTDEEAGHLTFMPVSGGELSPTDEAGALSTDETEQLAGLLSEVPAEPA